MKITKERLLQIVNEEISAFSANKLNEATRSTIAIEDKNGKVRGTYVHSDGYLDGVGDTLSKHYKDKKKIEQLLDLGKAGISGLYKSIDGGDSHSFNSPKKGETIFYGRDRGEDNDMTSQFKDRAAFATGHSEEFAYMYSMKDKKWYSATDDDRNWTELK
tara:strand:+ start:212 stop:691 length:480 start_codon:yes stop_codon:yes gene_type:complete